MNRYTGDECPVCNVTFHDGDDVVVCPVCGSPHHRACYGKDTGCAHSDWHGIKTYEDEKRAQREETARKCDNGGQVRCSRCGSQNPSDGLFCQVCGNSLRQHGTQEQSYSQGGFYGAPPPINPMPFTTPYGGLSPDEDIDGVSAKELAVFVGDNSFYFLPKMKELRREEKIVSWNWSAFLFNFYYFFYRKMYAVGAVVAALYIASSIPSILYTIQAMGYSDLSVIPAELQTLMNIANICAMLFWGVRILCGMFANYIYTRTAFNRVKKAREKFPVNDINSPEYVNELSLRGRTSHKAILFLCLVEIALSNILLVLLI